MLGDYATLKTLPAILSVAFVVASLYQFGGIAQVELVWLSNYVLTQEHAVLASMAVYVAAFASSETKRFEAYEDWEKVAIALGPVVILGDQYVTEVHDFFINLGDPLGLQIAFLVTLVSWAVAVR